MTKADIELRSDTFTRPSAEMRQAMASAVVGDDVWNEDPTIHRLEQHAAQLMGKEAALFVSSGTQGNLVGVLAHVRHGDEIILGDQSHIFRYEVAGTAVVGGVQAHTVPNRDDGRLQPDEVQGAIRSDDIHDPRTGCIVLENTHNRCGGQVLTGDEMAQVAQIGHDSGIPTHLDGARIFNAAIALGIPPATLVAPVDSVTFCLSKGLGAPVGSLLCGSAAYIHTARRWRKLLGGGMRQAGILAAAGLFALDQNVERLADDHANARVLAEGLHRIPGIAIDPTTVQSNIVFFDISGTGIETANFLQRLADAGVRMSGAGGRVRAVTSYEVSPADIQQAISEIRALVDSAIPATV